MPIAPPMMPAAKMTIAATTSEIAPLVETSEDVASERIGAHRTRQRRRAEDMTKVDRVRVVRPQYGPRIASATTTASVKAATANAGWAVAVPASALIFDERALDAATVPASKSDPPSLDLCYDPPRPHIHLVVEVVVGNTLAKNADVLIP